MTSPSDEPVHITIVHRYFWPDTPPYAQMLYKIAKGLAAANYTVSVLTTQPSHAGTTRPAPRREIAAGIRIQRQTLLPEYGRKILLRLLNTLFFAVWVFIKLLCQKSDFVMVATTPPVLIATVIRWASYVKGFRYIYHCQDIHPEALELIGVLKNKMICKGLQRLDKKNVAAASAVVVLSEDMKETLLRRGLRDENIHIINNFIFEIERTHDFSPQQEDNFSVLFAGNLGRFQNLDKVIAAAHLLKEYPQIQFIFVGEGIERKKLEKAVGNLATVKFMGHVPVSKALEYMEQADIGLITIAPDVIRVAYPSKTMMYLAAGLPLLVMLEAHSSLAKFIKAHQLGYVCGTDSPQALAETLHTAFQNRQTLRKERTRIADLATRTFGESVTVRQWVNLFDRLRAPDA